MEIYPVIVIASKSLPLASVKGSGRPGGGRMRKAPAGWSIIGFTDDKLSFNVKNGTVFYGWLQLDVKLWFRIRSALPCSSLRQRLGRCFLARMSLSERWHTLRLWCLRAYGEMYESHAGQFQRLEWKLENAATHQRLELAASNPNLQWLEPDCIHVST